MDIVILNSMKLAKSIILATLLLIAIALPVLAVPMTAPTILTIDSVEGYRHVLELNDQMYLFRYTDSYASTPATSITNAYLIRLLNGVTELGATAPYAYFNNGYGQGIAIIYFSAATAPTWSGNYTIRFEGNPAISWSVPIPLFTSTTFSKWSTSTSVSDTSSELHDRLLYIANQLSIAWSDNLTELSNGISVLSTSGENYFEAAIPSLRTICPTLFISTSVQAVPLTKTKNTSADTSTSPWYQAMAWVISWLAITVALVWKLQATRAALFIFGVAMIGGSVTGFLGMLPGIVVGIIGGLAIVWATMWNRTA